MAYGLFPRVIPPQDRADALTIAGMEGVTPNVLAGFRRRFSADDDNIAGMTQMPEPTIADEEVIRLFRREFKRLLAPSGHAVAARKQWQKVTAKRANLPHRTKIMKHCVDCCGLEAIVEELVKAEETEKMERQNDLMCNSVKSSMYGRGEVTIPPAALANASRSPPEIWSRSTRPFAYSVAACAAHDRDGSGLSCASTD